MRDDSEAGNSPVEKVAGKAADAWFTMFVISGIICALTLTLGCGGVVLFYAILFGAMAHGK